MREAGLSAVAAGEIRTGRVCTSPWDGNSFITRRENRLNDSTGGARPPLFDRIKPVVQLTKTETLVTFATIAVTLARESVTTATFLRIETTQSRQRDNSTAQLLRIAKRQQKANSAWRRVDADAADSRHHSHFHPTCCNASVCERRASAPRRRACAQSVASTPPCSERPARMAAPLLTKVRSTVFGAQA